VIQDGTLKFYRELCYIILVYRKLWYEILVYRELWYIILVYRELWYIILVSAQIIVGKLIYHTLRQNINFKIKGLTFKGIVKL
jgi:hypothetical protein